MAKTQVFTEANLSLYDQLVKQYIDGADSKAIKSVTISGNTLKFYKISEPVGDSTPAYTIELPETDLSAINAAIAAINDESTGILATAKGYADTKVSELADGQVKSNKDAIAVLNGADTVEGSVAKSIKDLKTTLDADIATAKASGDNAQADVDALEAKVGDVSTLTTSVKSDVVSAVNEVKSAVDSAKTAGEVTVTTDSTTEGYLKTYTIKQGGVEISKIDIPKDLVVVSGEVVVDPEGQAAGTYIKLVIANQEAPIYINVKSLVDVYTAEQSATQIQLSISDTNEISATIVAGSVGTTELTDGSVTTVKIADANVTLAKLAKDVTDAIADAKKAGTDASAAVTALEEGAVATNTSNIATLQGLVGEGFEPISESFIRGLFA